MLSGSWQSAHSVSMTESSPSAAPMPNASHPQFAYQDRPPRVDAEGRWHSRERVQHPDPAALIDHKRMAIVKPTPRGRHLGLIGTGGDRQLRDCRSAAMLDDVAVREVPHLEVPGVHAWKGTVATLARHAIDGR